MRTIRHLTPRYIYNRTKVIIYEKVFPSHPWLTNQAICILDTILKPTDVGVEFGSGRSTKWLLSKINRLYSIESSDIWYKEIKNQNKKSISENRLIYLNLKTEEEYLSYINKIDDNSIDFCLIDGEYRDTCAIEMIIKIRNGGIIVVDNVNWFIPSNNSYAPNTLREVDGFKSKKWEKFAESVSDWRQIYTSNGVTDTALWFKSC